ncbi:hypothetical protein AJ87_09760 [Rhizobium yanglingense]|nr:hypothetical protein AJ87_09760 [Rhizobium yanglingense]
MRFVLFYIVACFSVSLAVGVTIYPIFEPPPGPAQDSSRQSSRPQAARMAGKTSPDALRQCLVLPPGANER